MKKIGNFEILCIQFYLQNPFLFWLIRRDYLEIAFISEYSMKKVDLLKLK